MRTALFRLLFSILIVSPVYVCAESPAPPPPEADSMLARAVDALERKDSAAAQEAIRQIREAFPLPAWNARVDFLLAKSAFDLDSPASAATLASFDAAPIGLEPYRNYYLAVALERQGRRGEARDAFLRAAGGDDGFALLGPAALEICKLSSGEQEELACLAPLERASRVAAVGDLSELLNVRVRLGVQLKSRAILDHAASDLLTLSPALLHHGSIAPQLRSAARDAYEKLPAAEKVAVLSHEFEQGGIAAALAESARIPTPGLAPPAASALALLRCRALARLNRFKDSDREAALVPRDGSAADFRARLQEAENAAARLFLPSRGKKRKKKHGEADPPAAPGHAAEIADRLALVTSEAAPPDVRRLALTRLLHFRFLAGDRAGALAAARALSAIEPAGNAGFEQFWREVWQDISEKGYPTALAKIGELLPIYTETSAHRRLQYWQARCLELTGQSTEAARLLEEVSHADPADLYARFASAGKPEPLSAAQPEPLESTASFARVDELLRLHLYREAQMEASRQPDSRERSLRLAAASFALGDFLGATRLVKAAFPDIGTAREAIVPEPWRRLYYPIDPGGLIESAAKEFGLDRCLLLAVVRQESAFNPRARSRAGAAGLTQLMPGTARQLSRRLLKQRFRKSFLYDPGINVRLGASYLKSLIDRFPGNTILAVASYNAGPGRVDALLRDHPDLPNDEALESFPAPETRDYVRRVFLYAESYRELYPAEPVPGR